MKLNLFIGAAALAFIASSVHADSQKQHEGHDARGGMHSSVSSADNSRSRSSSRDRTTDGPVDQGRNATGADEIQTPHNDGTSGADETRGSGTRDR